MPPRDGASSSGISYGDQTLTMPPKLLFDKDPMLRELIGEDFPHWLRRRSLAKPVVAAEDVSPPVISESGICLFFICCCLFLF